MDVLTAIGFALEACEQRHPLRLSNFRDYTGTSANGPDRDGRFLVRFSWQRKDSTHGAETFFEAVVNGWNGETTVSLVTSLDMFDPADYELYKSADGNAWLPPPEALAVELRARRAHRWRAWNVIR